MIGWSGWKSAATSAQQIVAALVGQDIVARSISLTQAATSIAVQLVTGARLKLGTGTTDYLVSDGTTGVVSGGALQSGTTLRIGSQLLNPNGQNVEAFGQNTAGDTTILANAADGATTTAFNFVSTPALATLNAQVATFWRGAGFTNKVFAIDQAGKIADVPNTDSSGTPGNATANTPTGKAAIALGAASCVISNTSVTAASRIFISVRARDSTGLLPAVTAQVAATSFTVSVVANCTADLPFDWWLID